MNASKHRYPKQRITAVLCSLLLMGLTGCANKVERPTNYMLPSTSPQQLYPNALAVTVAPVSISSYLDNEGIVMELNDIEVYQARHHLWAEDIAKQLQQQLQQQIAASLPQAQVVTTGQALQAGLVQQEVKVKVSRFQGGYSGSALVQGQWQLVDAQGQLLQQQAFNIEQPLAADGYSHLVRSLAAAWDQVAQQIVAAMVKAPLGP